MLTRLRVTAWASSQWRLRRDQASPVSVRPRIATWIHDTGSRLFTSSAGIRHDAAVQTVATRAVGKSLFRARPDFQSHAHAHAHALPLVCPGCGAYSQTVEPEASGYYDVVQKRKAVYRTHERAAEDAVFARAMSHSGVAKAMADIFGGDGNTLPLREPGQGDGGGTNAEQIASPRLCARCHALHHYSRGSSIIHPSMQSIQQIIQESPHMRNHIYHVLDAADFPLSLIPNLQHSLDLPRLRTQNRRSKNTNYRHGRVADVSFIITRSDLLASRKEEVDAMMPYLQEVLRDTLSRRDRAVRLGNVRCVSAKRGWWTRTVKEEIWDRGGAGWMVGKVNVGKSALFNAVFPKGRTDEVIDLAQLRHEVDKEAIAETDGRLGSISASGEATTDALSQLMSASKAARTVDAPPRPSTHPAIHQTFKAVVHAESDLLPPARTETPYPDMPLVSALPGTTASPIRIPFGDGKGELIDLPGIHRSSLEEHVKAEHQKDLVMRHRVVPESYTIKPGQSLLLGGGVVRITPKTDDLIMLAFPFVPTALKPHVTSTQKAIAIQTGTFGPDAGVAGDGASLAGLSYSGFVSSILTDAARGHVQSAGTFRLDWNVTKRRTGPLTDTAAGKQKADSLPFIIYSADVLVEGCGWIELTCQVRKRRASLLPSAPPPEMSDEPNTTDAFSALEWASTARESTSEGAGVSPTQAKPTDTIPSVEVFTPLGKYIGLRRPMNAWVLSGRKKLAVHARRMRPRRPISFVKRRAHSRQST